MSRTVVAATIVAVCRERFLTLGEIAGLLGRRPATLQNHYLNQLVKEGRLELRFASTPSHPRQAYRTFQEDGGTPGADDEVQESRK